jgi:hypothetical protein
MKNIIIIMLLLFYTIIVGKTLTAQENPQVPNQLEFKY